MDLHLSISDGFVKTKIYDKRDDFDFEIVNFPFLAGDVPRSASYICLYFSTYPIYVYISQLIRERRHAWLLIQSRLTALLISLIARR